MSKFRMLTAGYRVGSSGCGSEPCTTDFRLPPTFAAASVCRFAVVHFNPNSLLFRTCGCFLACTNGNHRLYPSVFYTTSDMLLLCFAVVMLRGFKIYALWMFFLFATANCLSESLPVESLFKGFFLSACNPGRIDPHVQKDFPFALCSLQASNCVISSMIMSSVMSVFPYVLYNTAVRSSTSVPSC